MRPSGGNKVISFNSCARIIEKNYFVCEYQTANIKNPQMCLRAKTGGERDVRARVKMARRRESCAERLLKKRRLWRNQNERRNGQVAEKLCSVFVIMIVKRG